MWITNVNGAKAFAFLHLGFGSSKEFKSLMYQIVLLNMIPNPINQLKIWLMCLSSASGTTNIGPHLMQCKVVLNFDVQFFSPFRLGALMEINMKDIKLKGLWVAFEVWWVTLQLRVCFHSTFNHMVDFWIQGFRFFWVAVKLSLCWWCCLPEWLLTYFGLVAIVMNGKNHHARHFQHLSFFSTERR